MSCRVSAPWKGTESSPCSVAKTVSDVKSLIQHKSHGGGRLNIRLAVVDSHISVQYNKLHDRKLVASSDRVPQAGKRLVGDTKRKKNDLNDNRKQVLLDSKELVCENGIKPHSAILDSSACIHDSSKSQVCACDPAVSDCGSSIKEHKVLDCISNEDPVTARDQSDGPNIRSSSPGAINVSQLRSLFAKSDSKGSNCDSSCKVDGKKQQKVVDARKDDVNYGILYQHMFDTQPASIIVGKTYTAADRCLEPGDPCNSSLRGDTSQSVSAHRHQGTTAEKVRDCVSDEPSSGSQSLEESNGVVVVECSSCVNSDINVCSVASTADEITDGGLSSSVVEKMVKTLEKNIKNGSIIKSDTFLPIKGSNCEYSDNEARTGPSCDRNSVPKKKISPNKSTKNKAGQNFKAFCGVPPTHKPSSRCNMTICDPETSTTSLGVESEMTSSPCNVNELPAVRSSYVREEQVNFSHKTQKSTSITSSGCPKQNTPHSNSTISRRSSREVKNIESSSQNRKIKDVSIDVVSSNACEWSGSAPASRPKNSICQNLLKKSKNKAAIVTNSSMNQTMSQRDHLVDEENVFQNHCKNSHLLNNIDVLDGEAPKQVTAYSPRKSLDSSRPLYTGTAKFTNKAIFSTGKNFTKSSKKHKTSVEKFSETSCHSIHYSGGSFPFSSTNSYRSNTNTYPIIRSSKKQQYPIVHTQQPKAGIATRLGQLTQRSDKVRGSNSSRLDADISEEVKERRNPLEMPMSNVDCKETRQSAEHGALCSSPEGHGPEHHIPDSSSTKWMNHQYEGNSGNVSYYLKNTHSSDCEFNQGDVKAGGTLGEPCYTSSDSDCNTYDQEGKQWVDSEDNLTDNSSVTCSRWNVRDDPHNEKQDLEEEGLPDRSPEDGTDGSYHNGSTGYFNSTVGLDEEELNDLDSAGEGSVASGESRCYPLVSGVDCGGVSGGRRIWACCGGGGVMPGGGGGGGGVMGGGGGAYGGPRTALFLDEDSPCGLQLSSEGDFSEKSGLVGLRNIGNTCFLNSVTQCLSNTRCLLEYLVQEGYSGDYNTSLSTMKGDLIRAFGSLVSEMWSEGRDSSRALNTGPFKTQIQRFAPTFTGYQQHDAQEFLRKLLEGLHEDVNRVSVRPRPILSDIDDDLSDDQKAMESWKRYLRFDDSKIVDMFVGQLKSSLQCSHCSHTSVTFDPFWDLSLPIPNKSGGVRLNQCLDLFTKEEVMDGDERPTCSKCKERRKMTKSFSIKKFPKVLVLHLKRFSPTERWRGKLSCTVEFPLENLDLSKYASNTRSSNTYNLIGVANHSGTTYSGHYTAFCRHPYSGQWHEYNDSRVSSIPGRRVCSPEAYVLFYELAGTYKL